MDDKLINPIPEFVTAEERDLPNFQPKDKEE